MADSYQQFLEREAELTDDTPKGRKRRADLEQRIAEYNAALSYAQQERKPYLIPGEFNKGGWVYKDFPNKEFVTVPASRSQDAELADTVAHEGLHARRESVGAPQEQMAGYVRGQLGHPDFGKLLQLREILRQQKTYPLPENYNANPEETYATYAGIEGRLPRGTAITSQPEFSEIAKNQRLKDLLFSETSVPYGGVWEGQSQPSLAEQINSILPSGKQIKEAASQMMGRILGIR